MSILEDGNEKEIEQMEGLFQQKYEDILESKDLIYENEGKEKKKYTQRELDYTLEVFLFYIAREIMNQRVSNDFDKIEEILSCVYSGLVDSKELRPYISLI